MPLRDHFRPPLSDRIPWEGIHGGWPMVIVQDLARRLPPEYVAVPRVHLGPYFEIDVATFESGDSEGFGDTAGSPGGTATAVWSPARPSLDVETDLSAVDEYEVRVYDTESGRRLVAAVELVSPANKDRPEHRRAFVAKCAALLQQGVAVAIVDLVTIRNANLYRELLDLIGVPRPAGEATPLYAVALRATRRLDRAGRLEAWEHPLALGQPVPTLPLWLDDERAIPLDLNATYEDTCRALRIP